MLRLFWGAFALACGVTQAFPAPPTPADDSGSAPDALRVEARGTGRGVRSKLPRLDLRGRVHHGRHAARIRGLRRGSQHPGAVLVLDSDGGSVLGTLALGRSIRNLGMITTIGKTATLPPTGDSDRRATLSPNGNCEIHVRVSAAGRRESLCAARGARSCSPDLARQEAQAGAGVQLFRRGAQRRSARHRASRAIHDRDGRQRRSARNGPCGFRHGSRCIGSPG